MFRRSTIIQLNAAMGALMAVVGLLVGPWAHAEEVTAPTINCPTDRPLKGFEYQSDQTSYDAAQVGISAGSLPEGLRLNRDTFRVEGTAKTEESTTFQLTATNFAMDGAPIFTQRTCFMTVRPSPKITRIGGADRYDQALKVSGMFASATTVFVASGEKFADALSATAIAAARKAPILLTPGAALAPGVLEEIARLGVKDVVVVGGGASVSTAVFDALKAAVRNVVRIGGADRYEVSRNLISDPQFGSSASRSLLVVTGANFPDALSASPAASVRKAPVLLIDGRETALTPKEAQIVRTIALDSVDVYGGPDSVTSEVTQDIFNTAPSGSRSTSGAKDRYLMSQAINRNFISADAVVLASGEVFPDALSGGVLAGAAAAPLYVTPGRCVADGILKEIGRLEPSEVVILGGPATLNADVEALKPCGFD